MSVSSVAVDASVIVPFYNAEPYLQRCIEGLLAQDFPPERFEILMVDNNSTDGGAAIVRRYPRVQLLRERKQGAYAARNHALARARGELIAFTDPDCIAERGWLATLLAPFVDPGVQVVNGRALPVPGSQLLALLTAYEHQRDAYIFASADPTLYFGHTNNLATRRATLQASGGFQDRARGSDAIFVRQVTERFGCGAVRYVPAARVMHLEMNGLRAYLRKISIYRASRESFSEVTPKRTPTLAERFTILRRAVAAGDVSLVGALPVVALLAAGAVYGRVGAIRRRSFEPLDSARRPAGSAISVRRTDGSG